MSLFYKHLYQSIGAALIAWCATLAALAAPLGESAQARGLAIFTEADQRDSGFGDLIVELKMVLKTASGRTSERDLEIKQLEVADDGDKLMVVFNTPPSIRGTALLSHAHKLGDDDQWLFLPALKRVKKIAARNKSGPFVGSEFAFEDLSAQELGKYDYEFLRQEPCGGLACFVVARFPLDKYSGYEREVFWIDTTHYRTQKVEFYDGADVPLKRLQVSDYRQYGTFWKAHNMLMSNLRSNKSTELIWSEYRFGNGLTADRDFSVASLRRVR